MTRRSIRWALVALLATGFAAGTGLQARAAAQDHDHAAPAAAQDHDHAAPAAAQDHDAAAPSAGARKALPVGRDNVVANEMRALTAAMHVAVLAIANDDLAAIPPALHAVHAAREKTEQAIHAGTYQPPRNGAQLGKFVALDEAFHDELVQLVRAAQAGDSAAAARRLGPIMNACVGCHQQFRR